MLKEQIKEYKQIQKDHQKNLGPSEQDLMSPDQIKIDIDEKKKETPLKKNIKGADTVAKYTTE